MLYGLSMNQNELKMITIRIQYRFNMDSVWIQRWFENGFNRIQNGFKIDSIWCQYEFNMVWVWVQFGSNISSICMQYGSNVAYQYGFIVGPSWIQFEPTMTSALIHWCFKLNSIWFKYELILASMWIQYGFNWDWRFPVEFNADSIQI